MRERGKVHVKSQRLHLLGKVLLLPVLLPILRSRQSALMTSE